jgi:hypothetical protein
VSPTAIKANNRSTSLEDEFVVLWTEYFAAQGFQDDAPPRNRVDFFVKPKVATFVCKHRCVLFWIVLSQP